MQNNNMKRFNKRHLGRHFDEASPIVRITPAGVFAFSKPALELFGFPLPGAEICHTASGEWLVVPDNGLHALKFAHNKRLYCKAAAKELLADVRREGPTTFKVAREATRDDDGRLAFAILTATARVPQLGGTKIAEDCEI